MNVLFINRSDSPGVYGIERWMIGLGTELRRQGHWVGVAGREGSALLRAARERGLFVFPYRVISGLSWIAAIRLHAFFIQYRIHFVCVKYYKDLRVAARARLDLPVSVFIRRGAMGDVQDRVKDRLALRGANGVIVPSEALKKQFCRARWLRPEKVHVMHHAIDLSEFENVQPKSGLAECPCRVAYVGRLHPVKGTDVLLQAWATVVAKARYARLLLVGGGDQATYERMAADLGIRDSVDFAGYQEDVKPWIAAADFVVLPSREEGGGLVVLESLALGKPVIASDVGGIPEYIEDGKTGYLVPPGDANALAGAILWLMGNPDKLLQMEESGQAQVQAKCGMPAAAQRFLRVVSGQEA